MNIFHIDLKERWTEFSVFEQMANIGAEVGRAINWRNRDNRKLSRDSFYRALELIDFTVEAHKGKADLSEILRVREVICDYFVGSNIYKSSDEGLNKYFYFYNFAARKDR